MQALLREAPQAHFTQRVSPEGFRLVRNRLRGQIKSIVNARQHGIETVRIYVNGRRQLLDRIRCLTDPPHSSRSTPTGGMTGCLNGPGASGRRETETRWQDISRTEGGAIH
jgi:hypothetical protein